MKEFLEENYEKLFGEPDARLEAEAMSTQAQGPEAQQAQKASAAARLVGLYGGLLGQERNFFTRRQSLKLLAEILLDRVNFAVMMRFISSKSNLKTMMMLLIDKSANIQYEAFHVFKVFVANPRKPPEIVAALVRNKDRLVGYLQTFHADKQDQQFVDEKALIIDTLTKLSTPGCLSISDPPISHLISWTNHETSNAHVFSFLSVFWSE